MNLKIPLGSTSFPAVRKVKVVNRMSSLATTLFAALAALIFLTGCSTAKMYDGPAKAKDQVALLYRHANYVRILSVDGQKIPWMKRATVLELLPGPHTVQCNFESDYMGTGYTSTSSANSPIRLSFDAQPGYSYWIDSNVDPFKRDWQPKIISRPSNKEEPAN